MNLESKIVLTFDVDWCGDEVLYNTLDIIENADISATFFMTHETPIIHKMRNNKNIELGIHPNFCKLLAGESSSDGSNYMDIFQRILRFIPEARSFRSHALTVNSHILLACDKLGITHESNLYIPKYLSAAIKPHKYIDSKLIRVPFFWEDDIHCMELSNGLAAGWDVHDWLMCDTDPRVFNFHPIHVFLNTEDMSRYEAARAFFNDYGQLKTFINPSAFHGAGVFLRNLIREAKEMKLQFSKVSDIIV